MKYKFYHSALIFLLLLMVINSCSEDDISILSTDVNRINEKTDRILDMQGLLPPSKIPVNFDTVKFLDDSKHITEAIIDQEVTVRDNKVIVILSKENANYQIILDNQPYYSIQTITKNVPGETPVSITSKWDVNAGTMDIVVSEGFVIVDNLKATNKAETSKEKAFLDKYSELMYLMTDISSRVELDLKDVYLVVL